MSLQHLIRQEAAAHDRLDALDALRGLAALSVAATHLAGFLPGFVHLQRMPFWAASGRGAQALWLAVHSPLAIFWSGNQAVVLFFVISGFVLTRSAQHQRAWHHYALGRFCRLYIPYAVSMLLAGGLQIALCRDRSCGGLDWGRSPVTASLMLDHAFMLGIRPLEFINIPIWSIIHEFRISLLLPAILLLGRRIGFRALGLAWGIIALAGATVMQSNLNVDDTFSVATTLTYSGMFACGVMMAVWQGQLRSLIQAQRQGVLIAAAALAIAAIASSWPQVPTAITYERVTLASIVLVGLATHWPSLRRLLGFRLLVKLGTISYSLYLTHFILLEAMWVIVQPRIGSIEAGIIFMPAALLVATLFHSLVEKPSIKWGRHIRRVDKPVFLVV